MDECAHDAWTYSVQDPACGGFRKQGLQISWANAKVIRACASGVANWISVDNGKDKKKAHANFVKNYRSMKAALATHKALEDSVKPTQDALSTVTGLSTEEQDTNNMFMPQLRFYAECSRTGEAVIAALKQCARDRLSAALIGDAVGELKGLYVANWLQQVSPSRSLEDRHAAMQVVFLQNKTKHKKIETSIVAVKTAATALDRYVRLFECDDLLKDVSNACDDARAFITCGALLSVTVLCQGRLNEDKISKEELQAEARKVMSLAVKEAKTCDNDILAECWNVLPGEEPKSSK